MHIPFRKIGLASAAMLGLGIVLFIAAIPLIGSYVGLGSFLSTLSMLLIILSIVLGLVISPFLAIAEVLTSQNDANYKGFWTIILFIFGWLGLAAYFINRNGPVSKKWLWLAFAAVVLFFVIPVIVLVMVGLNTMQPAVSETQTYWAAASPFAITGWKYSGSELDLILVNKENQPVTLTNISIAGNNQYIKNLHAMNNTFAVGELKIMVITGITNCGATGASFDLTNIQFTYDKGTMTGLKQKGGKDLIGKCASADEGINSDK